MHTYLEQIGVDTYLLYAGIDAYLEYVGVDKPSNVPGSLIGDIGSLLSLVRIPGRSYKHTRWLLSIEHFNKGLSLHITCF